MIPFASLNSNRELLGAMDWCGWGCLWSPHTFQRNRPAAREWLRRGLPLILDNGAYAAFEAGRDIDFPAFRECLADHGENASHIVLPDIVGGGPKSLERSLQWVQWLGSYRSLLLPVQDGMVAEQVAPHLSSRIGVFVGGTTEWKWRTMAMWCEVARGRDAWCHVGRVNKRSAIHKVGEAGANSFDGTNVTRFSDNFLEENENNKSAHKGENVQVELWPIL